MQLIDTFRKFFFCYGFQNGKVCPVFPTELLNEKLSTFFNERGVRLAYVVYHFFLGQGIGINEEFNVFWNTTCVGI